MSERNHETEDFGSFFRFLDSDGAAASVERKAEPFIKSRPVLANRSQSTVPSITAFEERAAILEHDAGMSRTEANRTAAKEFGFPHPRAFFVACLRGWRTAIEAAWLPPAQTDEDQLRAESVAKLRSASLAFLDGDRTLEAVHCGWCEIQLFGVYGGIAPAARLDVLGLIPLLTWSVLGLELAALNSEHALLMNKRGARLKHPRFRHGHNEAVPWWTHQLFGVQEGNGP